jgi:fluoroacetyl-CoA thioesterase
VTTRAGIQATIELVVTDPDTASFMRSGEVAVLATPRLVALCEEATVLALAAKLAEGQTSVGSSVELSHLVPVRVGSKRVVVDKAGFMAKAR